MANLSKIAEILPEGYGYVQLIGVGNMIMNLWMATNVSLARQKHDVKLPLMYHEDPNHVFNCIQRVHQNTCENNALFLFLLMTSGLQYPKVTAGAGVVYLLSRIAYAKGYYSGDPNKRAYGLFGHLGQLVLIGGAVALGLNQLKWWPFN